MGEAARTIITAVVASAATFVGSYFTFINKDRELDLKMVDVSLAILRGEKGEKESNQSIHARRFALRALRSASNIEISDAELEEWAKSRKNLQLTPVNAALGQAIGTMLNGNSVSEGLLTEDLISELRKLKPDAPDQQQIDQLIKDLQTTDPVINSEKALFLRLTAWGLIGKIEKWRAKQ